MALALQVPSVKDVRHGSSDSKRRLNKTKDSAINKVVVCVFNLRKARQRGEVRSTNTIFLFMLNNSG